MIDTTKNQIIYALVLPRTRCLNAGVANRFEIRSHSEHGKGAAIRSLLPAGDVTTLKPEPEQKVVVMHKAKAVEHIDEDRAGRTKVAAEVASAHRLMADWKYGWHRVTVYGDCRNQAETASALLGFEIFEGG